MNNLLYVLPIHYKTLILMNIVFLVWYTVAYENQQNFVFYLTHRPHENALLDRIDLIHDEFLTSKQLFSGW